MRIIVNDTSIGELFFSLPQPEELKIAEEQICNHCRNALQHKENSRLEYELEEMKRTGTAYHFLILKEICSISEDVGHPIAFNGGMGGSFISYLLGISPINPEEGPFISSELIWAVDKDSGIPGFELSISASVRPLLQKKLDEKFGFVKTNDSIYYRVVITDSDLCDELSIAEINIKNFDTDICTAVLQKLFPEQKNVSCNFEQLVNFYAYDVGSFSSDISIEDLLEDNAVVTRDKLYFLLKSNNVPKELAIEVVKKGVWSKEPKKSGYLLQLEKYALPENVIYSFNNAEHLWNVPSCVSRLSLLCQMEYDLRKTTITD